MRSFFAATSPRQLDAHRFAIDVDDQWLQGRGAYGGVVSAMLARAVLAGAEPRRRLRSLTVSFTAPVRPGAYTIDTEVVREGINVATVAASLKDGAGKVAATALCTLAAARNVDDDLRASTTRQSRPMPQVKPPRDLETLPYVEFMPVFTRHLEWKFATDAVPGSEHARAEVGAWLRFRQREGFVVDEAMAIGLLDATPPAILSAMPRFVPAASVEWTVQLTTPLPVVLGADEFVLVHAECHAASDGYAEELDTLWTEDGRLLGQARQTIALV